MKYIIMCGGNYSDKFTKHKALQKVCGEILVERTIRLLRENGINDIGVSATSPLFDYLDVEILHHNNQYIHGDKIEHKKSEYCWLNAFYPTTDPCCYLFGDVYYSEDAIKKIIEAKVKDHMFFCIRDKQDGRSVENIKGREPLAFKIQDQKQFRDAINDMLKMVDDGKFENCIAPFSWHMYRYLNGLDVLLTDWGELNNIFKTKGNYITIEDYTCDIDNILDISRLENMLKKGDTNMVKVEVIERFTLGDYHLLKNIVRKAVDKPGELFVGDVFECDENMAKYLTGGNKLNKVVVKVIEIIPEQKPIKLELEDVKVIANEVNKVTKKTTKKKTSKK